MVKAGKTEGEGVIDYEVAEMIDAWKFSLEVFIFSIINYYFVGVGIAGV